MIPGEAIICESAKGKLGLGGHTLPFRDQSEMYGLLVIRLLVHPHRYTLVGMDSRASIPGWLSPPPA